MLNEVIIGIGGNIYSTGGYHPVKICNEAIRSFQDYSIKVKKQSKWYNSKPIPRSDQPDFFNCVVIGSTNLNEHDVLNSLHKIEAKFGRTRTKINESRSIDLDLIDYSNKVHQDNNLIIPHPRAHLRKFVMGPLAEINPNWIHPVLKISVFEILKRLNKQKLVEFSIEKLN